MSKKDLEWWKTRIRVLKGLSEEAQEFCPDVSIATDDYQIEDEDVGAWSFQKLLTLSYYISVYTTIAKSNFSEIFYIDLFAGDGFNFLRGINEAIVGSPVIAYIVPRKKTKTGASKEFDELILVENDIVKAKRLSRVIPDNAIIFQKNANDPEVMDYIEKRMKSCKNPHYFAFIDPYCMQIKWPTLERLLKLPGDLIINFMTRPISRVWGSYHSEVKEERPSKDQFNEFFGDDSWLLVPPARDGGSTEDLLNIYIEKIGQYRKKIIPIKVRGLTGSFCYHMIVATKQYCPWEDAINRVKSKVESVTDRRIKELFDIFNGRQGTIDDFFPTPPSHS